MEGEEEEITKASQPHTVIGAVVDAPRQRDMGTAVIEHAGGAHEDHVRKVGGEVLRVQEGGAVEDAVVPKCLDRVNVEVVKGLRVLVEMMDLVEPAVE